jgi:putative two-component system response regulator
MEFDPTNFRGVTASGSAWNPLLPLPGKMDAAAGAKILIVDPSVNSRACFRKILSASGHQVIEASTTAEAISAISKQGIELVLVDQMAPEMGAAEFCRVLRKASATQLLPVFVTAARNDLEAEVRSIEAGADEFLVAPFREKALLARVQARIRRKALIDSLDDSETVLFSLAQSVEERDPDLGQHCHRLAVTAAAMGLALGLPPADLLTLQRGGYLHDVGKVAIPDSVLFKPGPLTPDEWETMKTHAERGERICGGMRSLAPVLPIIRHHHEKWDGTGYPDGLKGEQIPLLARILQLADIYDALTTARPYKRAFTPEEALRVMREEAAKGWRDPKLVEIFADVLPMLSAPTAPDMSRFSLHALASSLEQFQNHPERSASKAPAYSPAEEPLAKAG